MDRHPLDLFKFCPRCGSGKFVIKDFKAKKCNQCEFVYYFNSSAATSCFITDKQGNLLVAERAKDPAKGTFDLPGGFVDMYETGEEAIRREVQEETGLDIPSFTYLFSLPNLYMYSGFEVHTLDMIFEAKGIELNTVQASDDVSRLLILSKDQINPDDFGLASIREAVKIWLKQS